MKITQEVAQDKPADTLFWCPSSVKLRQSGLSFIIFLDLQKVQSAIFGLVYDFCTGKILHMWPLNTIIH